MCIVLNTLGNLMSSYLVHKYIAKSGKFDFLPLFSTYCHHELSRVPSYFISQYVSTIIVQYHAVSGYAGPYHYVANFGIMNITLNCH